VRKGAKSLLEGVMTSLGLAPLKVREGVAGDHVRVYRRDSATERLLVGRLSMEKGAFVFRYERGYHGDPILDFPNVGQEYRSESLWPFFRLRVPPLDREDLRGIVARKRREYETRGRELDALMVLGEFAKLSITNPYELELAASES